MDDFDGLWFDCENITSSTTDEQCECEKECSRLLNFSKLKKVTLKEWRDIGFLSSENEVRLLRRLHGQYLRSGLVFLSSGFVSLDSSRPWICYWITHALNLLNEDIGIPSIRIVNTLNKMQNTSGGFGGGPQQLSHTAPNYAAVLTLCTLGTEESLSIIDRRSMYKW